MKLSLIILPFFVSQVICASQERICRKQLESAYGTCEFYNELEKLKPCSGGEYGYAIEYGEFYCRHITKTHRDKYLESVMNLFGQNFFNHST